MVLSAARPSRTDGGRANNRHALIDDAFINLRHAKTLLDSGTWGFFPGHTANTATSPLVILVLTGLGAVFGVNPGCVRLASALWLLLLLAILLRLSRRLLGKPWAGVVAFVALLANPLLLSTLGLESLALAVFFFAALVLSLGKIMQWPTTSQWRGDGTLVYATSSAP